MPDKFSYKATQPISGVRNYFHQEMRRKIADFLLVAQATVRAERQKKVTESEELVRFTRLR